MSITDTSTISNPSLLLRFMLFVLLSLTIMAVDYKKAASFAPVKTAFSIVVYPVQWLVDMPQAVFQRSSEFFATHDSLANENREHREKLEFFYAQQKLYQALKIENESLRKQLGAKPKKYHKFSIVDILNITRGNFKQVATLNSGEDIGVTVGQPVVSLGNIYGQIVEVAPYTSVVMQLTDPHHTIPVYNKRNGQSALATGTGELNLLKLKDVVANADVRNGDVYMSSGFGQLFPANYPVAEVTEVRFEPDDPFLTVKARTFVNYDTSRQALLLWKSKEQELAESEKNKKEDSSTSDKKSQTDGSSKTSDSKDKKVEKDKKKKNEVESAGDNRNG